MAFSASAGGSGIGHAFTRPLESLAPGAAIPVVPFYINCYYGPQPTAHRCYELGRAVREIVDAWPSDLRVAIIGSGGLWHTPMGRNAYIDQAFDRRYSPRSPAAMPARWRRYSIRAGPRSIRTTLNKWSASAAARGWCSAWGSGIGEIRNWIAASAVVDGTPGTVVDYVDINASPVGAGFAYWNLGS